MQISMVSLMVTARGAIELLQSREGKNFKNNLRDINNKGTDRENRILER